MGWPPQTHRQYIEMSRLYHRMQNLDSDRMVVQVHQFCSNLKYRALWITKVKSVFNKVGYTGFDETDMGGKLYVKQFSDKLKLYDQETWYQELFNDVGRSNGNKMRTYRLHKDRIHTEPFLHCVNKYERSVFSRLRTGTLPLAIETGRYNNLPLEERICEHCQIHIEDEVHFAIDCPLYDDIRYAMLQVLETEYEDFNSRSSVVKYILLMLSINVKIITSTIVKMFYRRKLHTHC